MHRVYLFVRREVGRVSNAVRAFRMYDWSALFHVRPFTTADLLRAVCNSTLSREAEK